MLKAPQRVVFVFSIVAFLLSTLLSIGHAEVITCSYLDEDFSGSSGISWEPFTGSWTLQGGRVQASVETAPGTAVYKTGFNPPDLFSVDVDVEWVEGSHIDSAYAVLPYTSGGVYFTVDGRQVSGVGSVVYPNRGTARLLAWDVSAQAYYQSAEYSLPAAVTSIGVAYYSDRVMLRANKSDTTVGFTGEFSYAAPGNIDTLWLFAQQAGTVVWFDNVCAASSSQATSQYTLTVTKAGSGTGLVLSSPSGINCGTACTASYNQGSTVTLTAVQDATSKFSGWTGGGCSGTGDCEVQMQSDINVTAQFDLVQTSKVPLPVGQTVIPYDAVESPVKNVDPLQAKPVGFGGVAEGELDFSVKVALEAFDGPVDIYFGLLCPFLDPNAIILLEAGGQIGFLSQDGLIAWKTNVQAAVEEAALPDLSILDVPSCAWYVYFLVTPHGDITNYYLWATQFFSPYDIDTVADKIEASLGEDDGFDAIVLAVDRGYELWEVVEAVMLGRLSADGRVTGAGGGTGDAEKRIRARISTSSLASQLIADEKLAQLRKFCRITGKELSRQENLLIYVIIVLLKNGYSLDQILAEGSAGGKVSIVDCSFDQGRCACTLGLFEQDCTYVLPQNPPKEVQPTHESYPNAFCLEPSYVPSFRGLIPQGGDGPCADTEPAIPVPGSYTLLLDVRHTRVIGDTSVSPEDWAFQMGTYNYIYSSLWYAPGNLSGSRFTSDFVRGDTKVHLSGFLSANADQITSFTYTQEEKYWSASFKGGPIPFSNELYVGDSEPGRTYELKGQAVCNAITEYKYDWPKDVGPQPAHYARDLVCDEYSYFKIDFNPEPPYEH